MATKLIICLVIFFLVLGAFLSNKFPLWLISLLSLSSLYVTGCINTSQALAGFSDENTILMGSMFILATGFQRTSAVDRLCAALLCASGGSFRLAFLGHLVLTILLSALVSSPMVVYSIVSPLLAALCDRSSISRTRYMFPLCVVAVTTSGILPGPAAILRAGKINGFFEAYGCTTVYTPMDFFRGAWPVLLAVLFWSLFLAPGFLPEYRDYVIGEWPSLQQGEKAVLPPFTDRAGILIFAAAIAAMTFSAWLELPAWWISLTGALLMVLCGVVDRDRILNATPWETILLYVGALALGAGLVSTGAGKLVGEALIILMGGSRNSYILGALFYFIPFAASQFMLNRAVIAVFTPICLLTCQAMEANPMGLILLINAGAMSAFTTPMSTPAVSMCMNDAGYQLRDLLKGGWLISGILAVLYVFYTMTVFPTFP